MLRGEIVYSFAVLIHCSVTVPTCITCIMTKGMMLLSIKPVLSPKPRTLTVLPLTVQADIPVMLQFFFVLAILFSVK